MDVREFYRKLRGHCAPRVIAHDPDENGGCKFCCFRMYCWTATCDRDDLIIEEAIALLDNPQDRTDLIDDDIIRYLSVRGLAETEDGDRLRKLLALRDISTSSDPNRV